MKRKRAGRDEPDFSPSASSDEASPDLPSPSFGSGSDDAWGSEDGAGAGAQGTDRRREKKRRALKDKAMKAKYKPKAEVSTTDVKKRIRDTERLLSRPNLPADVQQDLERRLRALQATLPTVTEQVYDKETSKKNYEKYKYVRFVERQKVTRKLKQVEKRLRKAEEDGEDADELRQEKEGLEVDLAYTLVGRKSVRRRGS
ncbi:hypothetical protein DFJ74DRAFT_680402 [Hyaloraphidium curvatum]|nr:hypothetical protein DFJ74DRAFT_680402 [Hyaloraphidium curvatum]